MRDIDAALVAETVDIVQRERKPDVHHHRKANDLGRSLKIFKRIAHRGRPGSHVHAHKSF